MSLNNLATLLVGHADHRAFLDVGMGEKRRFHFWPGDIVTRRNDHIVGARGKMKVAPLVLCKGVTGEIPAIADVGVLPLVGEITAAGGTADRKLADLAAGFFFHVVADDLGLVAAD